ncbi:hypothetical protein [Sphingopyxis sp. H115]|uniref:hypothetical protein n=1 Tax=Sphingopyxis sp. H115 TaxID=1759073 RepID=UPI000736D625|nr:hypothetical protein [Sphingopyxis sp. H115]KTE05112.1 hypothetical protein ATE71_18980 [Sphingopyxis sp. H115]
MSGGDRRIQLDKQGRNQYYASAAPSDALAYGSSTISSISSHAFEQLVCRWRNRLDYPMSAADYTNGLDAIRAGLAAYFGLCEDSAIVFAASGTDLEYVGLAAARDGRPITAVLLGRDEVGSGCVYSAAGRFFSEETATGARVIAQAVIDPAFDGIELIDVAVRDESGLPRTSAKIAAELSSHVEQAKAGGRRSVVHVVHGSKSGLTLPALAEVERLVSAHGDAMTVVVDACQLRITPATVRRYLELGCIVLMTGSKFAGGPPFSGFALVPGRLRDSAMPLPPGLGRLAIRAEWPSDWPGADCLDVRGNFGLLLRLEAALIEMERFAALPAGRIDEVSARFSHHVMGLVRRLELAEVPGVGGVSCLASGTLRTLDLSARWPECDFDAARLVHGLIARHSRHWLGQEIRLGQPVKTRRMSDGRIAGTLRLSLSMPLMAELAPLRDDLLDERLGGDMTLIGAAISAATAATLGQDQPAAA